jgi:PAS domain S-box-containing protein
MKKLTIALERLSLKTKLLLVFGILVLWAVSIGVDALIGQRRLTEQMQTMYDKELLGVSAIKEARFEYAQIGRIVRMAILADDPAERDRALKQLGDAELSMKKAIEDTRQRSFRADGKRELVQFEEKYALYRRNIDRAIGLVLNGDTAQAQRYVGGLDFQQPGIEANGHLGEMARIKETGAKAALQDAMTSAAYEEFTTLLLLLGGAGLCIFLGTLIARSIRRPTEHIRATVELLAKGQLELAVPHTDYPNEIGDLARSITVLQNQARLMEAQRWTKTQIAEISAELQQVTSFTELSQKLLSRLAPLIHLGHGVFYIFEPENKRLRLLSSYAFRERKNLDQYFALGQGLVGQCAMEMQSIVITDPPADYVRIGSSLGEAVPRTIAVLPVIRNGTLLGVLELATFESFGEAEQTLLDGVMPILAMSLEILERNVKTQQLLKETQRQAQNMEKQAAQLEEQTIEMEAQQGELKATETWYRGIIESAPDGMMVTNASGQITLANPKLELMFGYEVGDLVGKPIEILVPESIRGSHVGLRDGYIQTGGVRTMGGLSRELRGVRKDGSSFAVEVGLSKLPAVGGRGVNICATVRDITERKAAEQAIAASEERLAMALQGGNLGLWDWQADPDVLITNDIWSEMLGYKREEIDALYGNTAARWANMVWPEDMDFAVDRFVKFVNNELPEHRMEMRMKTKSGEPKWVLAVGAAAARDATGKVTRMVGIHQDINEKKLSEAMLAERMDELERFNHFTIDREVKMISLKKEINELLAQAGEESKYRIVT